MPYFKELNKTIEQIGYWADLRHEQEADIASILHRLNKELRRAKEKLMDTRPRKKIREREPNTLDAIRALRPEGPRKMWTKLKQQDLAKRLRGAWLGRAAGCTLGAPVESWSVEAMEGLAKRYGAAFPPEDFWPGHPSEHLDDLRYGISRTRDFLRGRIRAIPVDDDLAYTLLGLLILEEFGPDFSTENVATAWLKFLPGACSAEEVALENLRKGIPAQKAGVRNNPYQEWIGADIRSDPWAYAAPGWPEKAAEFAYRDAYLSHRYNGIYGAMFFAAAISAAFALDCPIEALEIGLTEIPAECRLAKDIRWTLDTTPELKDWRQARAAVDARFEGMHPVHANNNACLTVFGLYLGKRDFTKTIGTTVAMGLDNDCTAATAGSLLGAIIGAGNIPEHWWKPFRNTARSYLIGKDIFTNSDIVKRFLEAAKRTWSA
ncbi:MAG TPA: ADP-ribosylglycohydrolase family protein [Candidatus Hydrogenedentes bacterium]|nr:ADP-ribosylglycohydrolase family protein [Candidatus Hydrogenedentota bacterium]